MIILIIRSYVIINLNILGQTKELMDFKGQVQHILGSFTRGLILRMEEAPRATEFLNRQYVFLSFFLPSFLPFFLSFLSSFLSCKKKKSKVIIVSILFYFCSSRGGCFPANAVINHCFLLILS